MIPGTQPVNNAVEIDPGIDPLRPTTDRKPRSEFFGPADKFHSIQSCRLPTERAAEGCHEKPVFSRRQRSLDPFQIAGDLCYSVFHEFRGQGAVSEDSLSPLACLFPDLVSGRAHVRANRPARMIDLTVPPNKYSPCAYHECTIPKGNLWNWSYIRARRKCFLERLLLLGNAFPRSRMTDDLSSVRTAASRLLWL